MKIALNKKIVDGPYGGVMNFIKFIKFFLEKNKVEVVNCLDDNDIDIILQDMPAPLSEASVFSFYDAYLYKLKHPDTIIVHRINECDERKKTYHINNLLILISKFSDYSVYIASWLKSLLEHENLNKKQSLKVILNGADVSIFNTNNKKFWDRKNKLKIVTHHWSDNYLKGHDIYQQLDRLLDDDSFNDKFEFTYIGNYPKHLIYKNTKLIRPLNGQELADELKKHHVYITASINEPAGMHHIEGALCGLPLLYISSGALPEYCGGFGLKFDTNNLQIKLKEMHDNYDYWLSQVKNYNRTAEKMAQEYYELFLDLYTNKERYKIKDKQYLKYFYYYIVSKIFFLVVILFKCCIKIKTKIIKAIN